MKSFFILIPFTFIIFVIPNNAFAYLDPGTGSMLLQGLIAGIMVVCTTVGIFWRRIKGFFSRLTDRDK